MPDFPGTSRLFDVILLRPLLQEPPQISIIRVDFLGLSNTLIG